MSRPPEFETLVGPEVGADERERLRRVHELLVTAGPPAELSPELEAGPTLAMTLAKRPHRVRRRVMLLAAALVALILAFLGGYISANGSGTPAGTKTLDLAGTPAAPGALAALSVEPVDTAGNWPMELSATGLPKLPAHAYYEVFLVRDGKPFAPCGAFIVGDESKAISVHLNAPYHLRPGDSWVVTRQSPGNHEPGPVVLSPTA